jgi:hypothetical protein
VLLAGTALVLAVPIGAANAIDSLWLAGWYDEADGDQLVANSISPEGMIGGADLTPACLLSRAEVVARRASRRSPDVSDSAIARGPPKRTVLSTRPHSFHVVHLVLAVSPDRFLLLDSDSHYSAVTNTSTFTAWRKALECGSA